MTDHVVKRILFVIIVLTGRIATAHAQIGANQFEPLVRTSARRLAIGRLVAFAKWDSGSRVTDTAREEQVISSAIKEAEPYHLDRVLVTDFFMAQIEANKLVQFSLLADWHRAGTAPAHESIDLFRVIRPQLDKLQTELLKELANTTDIRANSSCPEYLAKAIGKYLAEREHNPDSLEKIALDRALAAACTDK
jgi:chorismate mutase